MMKKKKKVKTEQNLWNNKNKPNQENKYLNQT